MTCHVGANEELIGTPAAARRIPQRDYVVAACDLFPSSPRTEFILCTKGTYIHRAREMEKFEDAICISS